MSVENPLFIVYRNTSFFFPDSSGNAVHRVSFSPCGVEFTKERILGLCQSNNRTNNRQKFFVAIFVNYPKLQLTGVSDQVTLNFSFSNADQGSLVACGGPHPIRHFFSSEGMKINYDLVGSSLIENCWQLHLQFGDESHMKLRPWTQDVEVYFITPFQWGLFPPSLFIS